MSQQRHAKPEFTVHDRDFFMLGRRQYGNIVVERSLIDSDTPQASLLLQRVFRQDAPPKAQICMVHGLGEHSGRFLGLAKAFAAEGYAVFAIDLRGYGCSGGGRCQGSLREFLSDVQRLTERVDSGLPLFFWGNSMGAAIVNLFLLSNPQLDVAGVVLSSPFYRFPKEVKVDTGKRLIVSFLARNMPELVMGSKVSFNWLVKSKKTLQSYLEDDFVTLFVCLRMAETLMDISFTLKAYDKIPIQAPVLIMAGQKDKVTEYQYTVQLYDKIVSCEKKIHTFPDGLHQVYEDEESEEYMSVLLDWLNYKCQTYRMTKKNNLASLIIMPVLHSYYLWRDRVLGFIVAYLLLRLTRNQLGKLLRKVFNV